MKNEIFMIPLHLADLNFLSSRSLMTFFTIVKENLPNVCNFRDELCWNSTKFRRNISQMCWVSFFHRISFQGTSEKTKINLAGEWAPQNAPTRTSVGQLSNTSSHIFRRLFPSLPLFSARRVDYPEKLNTAKCRRSEGNREKKLQESDLNEFELDKCQTLRYSQLLVDKNPS